MVNAARLLEDLDLENSSTGALYHELCDAFPLQRIKSKRHHRLVCRVLEKVMLCLQNEQYRLSKQEKVELGQYVDALGVLVEGYEKETYPTFGKGVTGIAVLKYLMEEHGLRQADLKDDMGGQSVASEILSGKRSLNLSQIKALSKRFSVSPTVFFDN